jgi:hypothetical protein
MGNLKEAVYKIFESMSVKIAPPVSGGDRITVDFSKNPNEVPEEEETIMGPGDDDGTTDDTEEMTE